MGLQRVRHDCGTLTFLWASQLVKSLPAMWESWVQSLGHKDPVEKEMATNSSILTWRIIWTEEPGWLHTVHGVLEKEMATHSSILAWRIIWAEEPGWLHTVHGVTKSGTRLSD